MGYRHYFYKVEKQEVNKVKSMNFQELCDYVKGIGVKVDEDRFYFNDKKFLNREEVFEFGKLYWDDTAERIYNKGVPLFDIKEVQEKFDDYVPYIVGKEGLLEAIEIYKKKILHSYENLLVGGAEYCAPFGITIKKEDVQPIEKIREFIQDKLFWVKEFDLCDLDENHKHTVAHSWQYEHSIFNLVHLLKTIDWGKETLLFYGW